MIRAPRKTANAISTLGRRVRTVQADLRDPPAASRAVGAAISAFGKIDVLVHAAGVLLRARLEEASLDEYEAMMAVHVRATLMLVKAASADMIGRRRGKMIIITSVKALVGGAGASVYAASKAAQTTLTRALAVELAPQGIQLNAIAPGPFATRITASTRANAEADAATLSRIPAESWGRPNQIGGAVVFFASAASDHVCGVTLPVDGGYLAR